MNEPAKPQISEPPKNSADALKLNFDMTKQVMTTTATVITLLAIYLKTNGSASSTGISGAFAKGGAVLLLISLVLGMLGMGRQIAQFENEKYNTQERLTQKFGMAQHGAFILGMASVLILILTSK